MTENALGLYKLAVVQCAYPTLHLNLNILMVTRQIDNTSPGVRQERN